MEMCLRRMICVSLCGFKVCPSPWMFMLAILSSVPHGTCGPIPCLMLVALAGGWLPVAKMACAGVGVGGWCDGDNTSCWKTAAVLMPGLCAAFKGALVRWRREPTSPPPSAFHFLKSLLLCALRSRLLSFLFRSVWVPVIDLLDPCCFRILSRGNSLLLWFPFVLRLGLEVLPARLLEAARLLGCLCPFVNV